MTDEIKIPSESIAPAAPAVAAPVVPAVPAAATPATKRRKKAKKKTRKKTAKKPAAVEFLEAQPVVVVPAPDPATPPVPAGAPDAEPGGSHVVQPWRSKTLIAGLAQMLIGAADKVGNEPIFPGEESPGWILLGTGILTIILRYVTNRPIA